MLSWNLLYLAFLFNASAALAQIADPPNVLSFEASTATAVASGSAATATVVGSTSATTLTIIASASVGTATPVASSSAVQTATIFPSSSAIVSARPSNVTTIFSTIFPSSSAIVSARPSNVTTVFSTIATANGTTIFSTIAPSNGTTIFSTIAPTNGTTVFSTIAPTNTSVFPTIVPTNGTTTIFSAIPSTTLPPITSAPPPSSTPSPSFKIHPIGNITKCLDVRGAILANGTPVQIFDCNGTPAQDWVIALGEGPVVLAGTNFCLDAGSAPANGVGMKIWECFSNLPAQDWFYTTDQRIALTNQGFCLDLTDGNLSNSNQVQTWKCTDNDRNQIWSISK